MSRESYVSYETGKLLKEKGFDWECTSYWCVFQNGDIVHTDVGNLANHNGNKSNKFISRPTQQMACDWVEKTYGFFIEISRSIDLNGNYHYFYMILDKTCKYASSATKDNNYPSKSNAVEAALEFVLTKLI